VAPLYCIYMIRLVIWVAVLVLALSFFGISLEGLVESPMTQNNFSFILDLVRSGWESLASWFESLGDSVSNIWS
jgi:hypothetical protein